MTKTKVSFLESLVRRVQELQSAQGFKVLYAIGCVLNEKKVPESRRRILRRKILSEINKRKKEANDLRRILKRNLDPETGLSPLQTEAHEDKVPLH